MMRTIRSKEETLRKYNRMAWHIVNKMAKRLPPMESLDDLHSQMMVALMRCCEKFDEGKGVKFVTYAYMAMFRECKMYIDRAWKRGFSYCGGNVPQFSNFSLSRRDEEEEFRFSLESNIACATKSVSHYDEWDFMTRYIRSDDSKLVLWKVYYEGKCFAEVGREIGLHRERIRQLHNAGIADIREAVARGFLELNTEDLACRS